MAGPSRRITWYTSAAILDPLSLPLAKGENGEAAPPLGKGRLGGVKDLRRAVLAIRIHGLPRGMPPRLLDALLHLLAAYVRCRREPAMPLQTRTMVMKRRMFVNDTLVILTAAHSTQPPEIAHPLCKAIPRHGTCLKGHESWAYPCSQGVRSHLPAHDAACLMK